MDLEHGFPLNMEFDPFLGWILCLRFISLVPPFEELQHQQNDKKTVLGDL